MSFAPGVVLLVYFVYCQRKPVNKAAGINCTVRRNGKSTTRRCAKSRSISAALVGLFRSGNGVVMRSYRMFGHTWAWARPANNACASHSMTSGWLGNARVEVQVHSNN